MIKNRFIKPLILSVIPIFLLSGCFFMQTDTDTKVYEDRVNKAEYTVSKYIGKDLFTKTDTYKSYEFFPLTFMQHPEIKKLHQLYAKKDSIEKYKRELGNEYETQSKVIDQNIAQQKDSISINNWRSKYKIETMFSIVDKNQSKTIYEMRFYLNFTLDTVIHVEPIMRAVEPKAMRGVFYHFFSEMALTGITSKDTEFYSFYKSKLASLPSPLERGMFMEHCMEITAIAASKNSVFIDDLSQGMVQSHLKKDTLYADLKIAKFDDLYETIDSLGEAIKVKYDRNVFFFVPNDSTNVTDTLGIKYVFDEHMRIKNKLMIPPPYDSYFKP